MKPYYKQRAKRVGNKLLLLHGLCDDAKLVRRLRPQTQCMIYDDKIVSKYAPGAVRARKLLQKAIDEYKAEWIKAHLPATPPNTIKWVGAVSTMGPCNNTVTYGTGGYLGGV